jgi:hypothetical protein
MDKQTISGSGSAVELYHRLKTVPHEKMRSEGRAAMVRLSEQQVHAEKRHLAERARRLDPVHHELVAAVRKSPELKGVVRAIEALDRPHQPDKLPAAAKRRFAPKTPMVRLGSIHVVDSLPFFSDTWTWQDGDSNEFRVPPSADGTTGDMGFGMLPGANSNGHMACWAALGAAVAIPNSPCMISFTANPSVNWSYFEFSDWWREAKGNMWAGLYVGLFNADGTFLDSAMDTQISVASFDDHNLSGAGSDSGSTSAMPLSAATLIGFPFFGNAGAEGGFLQYWCWIGGSCNADGSNDQSGCNVQMNANCSNLTVDIFEF